MTFTESIRTVLIEKPATFSGRATRTEYWWFFLFSLLASVALSATVAAIAGLRAGDIANWIYAAVVLVPTLAVTARRLHDTDRSGWWQVITIPADIFFFLFEDASQFESASIWIVFVLTLAVSIIMIVWLASRGTEGPNRFGGDPKDSVTPEIFS